MHGPPLWLVERGSGVVHLFGVVAGARGDGWLRPVVREALEAADELWVETPPDLDIDGDPALPELATRDPDDAPDPFVADRLAAATEALGLPPASLEVFRPWLTVQIVDRLLLDRAGIDPASDVEHVLVRIAGARGIPIRTELQRETVVRELGELPDDVQQQHLEVLLDRVEEGADGVQRHFARWRAGDLESLDRLATQIAMRYPAFHRRLGIDRNEAWVPRIEAMLDEGRRSFVAVDVLHLVGPGSLLELLEAAGLPPTPV